MEEKMNVQKFKKELTDLIDKFEKDNGCVVNSIFIDSTIGFSNLGEMLIDNREFAIKVS